jgi:spore germination protein GerM
MNARTLLGVVLVVGLGLGARNLPPRMSARLAAWWPWTTTTVTLYFSDGRYIVPVSRRMTRNAELPRATLRALLAGPAEHTGLHNPLPSGLEIRSVELHNGVAVVDLTSSAQSGAPDISPARTAILESLTGLPDVSAVSLRIDGRQILQSANREPLLYYSSQSGLVAVPVSAATPRAALTTYLAGPRDPGLIGLPADVQLRGYEHKSSDGVLWLEFSYTGSVRTLALEQPDRMRLALLGLIASLTEFSSVRAVRLDFEGQSRLGLGQCSDLLQTPQRRPELLNDERLLGR